MLSKPPTLLSLLFTLLLNFLLCSFLNPKHTQKEKFHGYLNSSSCELLYFIGFDEKWADERVAAIFQALLLERKSTLCAEAALQKRKEKKEEEESFKRTGEGLGEGLL